MSAVPALTLGDIMDNLIFQCECSVDLGELSGIIHDYRITHDSIATLEVTQEISNQWLKELTGCVVGSGTDLNCYPVGLTDTVCFDLDGNPV